MATTNNPNFPLPISTIQTLQQQNLPSFKINFHNSLNQQPNHHQFNLDKTKQIHAQFLKSHFHINNNNTNEIFSYFQLHLTPSARFNFLITSYNNNNYPKYALYLYIHMRNFDFKIDSFIISSLLKSCAQINWVLLGREIHGFALKNKFDLDVFVGNTLIQMYIQCGFVEYARLVFDKMHQRDVVSWNTMIKGYVKEGLLNDALKIIREMQYKLMKPSESTVISMANLVAEFSSMKLMKSLLGYLIKNSNVDQLGTSVTTSMINLYAKSGDLATARYFFDRLEEKRVHSYTAMVAGYIRWNDLGEGVQVFREMIAEGISPSEISLLSLISECGRVEALDIGKQLHAYVLRNGFSVSLPLGTSLVDMYGKCCEISSARAIFDSVEKKDVMIWTALISAYAKGKCIGEAIYHFALMRENGLRPNAVTMVSLVSCCAESGTLDMGKWIHVFLDKQEIEIDTILRTALIDMYAKCGDVETAYELFDEAANRDLCMWNAMIMGFGIHGLGKEALKLFHELELSGIKPNDVSFIGLLTACSHSGMVSEGKRCFEEMRNKYGLLPKIEHYGCMVDLLGRAGLLYEAYDVIQNMPMKPNTIVWGALLAGCKVHKNPDLGSVAAKKLLEIDTDSCGHNVLISNIYAGENRWNDVKMIRKSMENRGMRKEPGFSCIAVNGSVHEFTTEVQAHPDYEKIEAMLDEMIFKLKSAGYKPDTSVVLLNIGDEEKEQSLKYHSEKIAMAYGLITTAPGIPIRIVKNLRVCDDCHNATKLLSRIYKRNIIVRDRNRFHHFSEGSCSCGDNW